MPEHAPRASRGHNLALARVSVTSAAILMTLVNEFPDHPIPAIPTTGVISSSLAECLPRPELQRANDTGSRDVGDKSRRGKIGITGPSRKIGAISSIRGAGSAGNYQGCRDVSLYKV